MVIANKKIQSNDWDFLINYFTIEGKRCLIIIIFLLKMHFAVKVPMTPAAASTI